MPPESPGDLPVERQGLILLLLGTLGINPAEDDQLLDEGISQAGDVPFKGRPGDQDAGVRGGRREDHAGAASADCLKRCHVGRFPLR